jgi:hypothetical protein
MTSKSWISVRLLFIALSACAGFIVTFAPSPLSRFELVFFLVFGALGTRFWIFRDYKKPGREEPWLLPSWTASPFQQRQPFQFAHLAGTSMAVFALCAMLRDYLVRPESVFSLLPAELFAGAFGIGMLLGIRWAVYSYRTKFRIRGLE